MGHPTDLSHRCFHVDRSENAQSRVRYATSKGHPRTQENPCWVPQDSDCRPLLEPSQTSQRILARGRGHRWYRRYFRVHLERVSIFNLFGETIAYGSSVTQIGLAIAKASGQTRRNGLCYAALKSYDCANPQAILKTLRKSSTRRRPGQPIIPGTGSPRLAIQTVSTELPR